MGEIAEGPKMVGQVAGDALVLSIAGEAIVGTVLAGAGLAIGVRLRKASGEAKGIIPEEVSAAATVALRTIQAGGTTCRALNSHRGIILEIPDTRYATQGGGGELPVIISRVAGTAGGVRKTCEAVVGTGRTRQAHRVIVAAGETHRGTQIVASKSVARIACEAEGEGRAIGAACGARIAS